MYYLVGTILIVAAAVLAIMASVGYILTIRGKRSGLGYGRVGVYGSLAMTGAMWVLVLAMFLTRRFDIQYVYSYSSSELNTFFTIAATWAGQPGSFAIWAVFNAIVAAFLVRKSRHFEPYVLAVVMLVQASILGLMLISNPFTPLTDPNTGLIPTNLPAEGQGLNPLLYNFWMILHPPVLFVAYALIIVPFAYAIAGLLRYDYDGWITYAFPWTLAAWVFLGLALFLGAYWSYETLGWGGYWGWDPVENSSLVPWLLLTALLHSMLVQRTHKSLRRTNFMLAMLTLISVMYATYLTRSGVLSNFSVHSFVAEGLDSAMIILQGVLIVGSLVVLLMRWFDIPSRPLKGTFFSRDSFMVLAVLTLVVITVVIILGTSMPVISAIPGVGNGLQDMIGSSFEINDGSMTAGQPTADGRFSLTPDFYKRTTPPLGLIMMLLLVIGPLTAWRDVDVQRVLLRGLRLPFVVAIVATSVAMLLGVRNLMALAFIAVSSMALGSNIITLIRHAKISWLRTGAQISHIGLCLMIIGIVGSSMYATPDERVVMSAGETVSINNFDITFNQWEATMDSEGEPDGRGVLDLSVQHGNSTFAARPQLYYSTTMQDTYSTPAIHTFPFYDLYISPAEYIQEENPSKPQLQRGELLTVGPYEISFLGFEVNEEEFQETGIAKVGGMLNVVYDGKTELVVPQLNLTADHSGGTDPDSFERIPATLPGGESITMNMFDPSSQVVWLEIEGLDVPIIPARAVITVSLKPIVGLVWIGILVGIFGGMVALRRRSVEGTQLLQGLPVRLPRGILSPSENKMS